MSEPTMQAVRYYQFGGPEVLQLEQIPIPKPGEGEVLIRVHSAGVLPIDWKIRFGRVPMPVQFPHIPGTAFAGVVEEVGTGVTAFEKGQSVFGRSPKGTYAEYTIAPVGAIAIKPQSISYDEGAALSGGATTAWRAIIGDGGVQAGEKVLIHGAAGGVGLFATQFAKWRGAHVVGTAGPANTSFVRSLGADVAIDYTSTRFEGVEQGFDLVLDTIGGDTLERSWSVIKPGGRIVSIVGQPTEEKAQEHGIQVVRPGLATHQDLVQIAKLIDEGVVQVVVEQTFALNEVRQAHERSQIGHGRGRIVLHVVD